MSSFSWESVNDVNLKWSPCQSVLHFYPKNQLFLKNRRINEASRYTQMVWLMYFKWLKNVLFHVLTPDRSMYNCSRHVFFNTEAEVLRAPSGAFSSWCAAVLKRIMHVNLATERRDLMSYTGLDLIIEIKFVIKWKQCQGEKKLQLQRRGRPSVMTCFHLKPYTRSNWNGLFRVPSLFLS